MTPVLERLARLRRQLETRSVAMAAAGPGSTALRATTGLVDLLVTHCEVSDRHGTGVLLRRLFAGGPPVASVRAIDLYGGQQDLGAPRLKLSVEGAAWPEVMAQVLDGLGSVDVRRILCVPYSPEDVRIALAAQRIFGAPMCTWVMDDRNIEADGLPDELLRQLFDASGLLLAISPELRQAYQTKFGRPFALAPPAVSAGFLQRRPVSPEPERVAHRHGMLFGNIWGERWLDQLLDTLTGAQMALDWYSGGGTPWRKVDPERLRRAGVKIRSPLPEPQLVASLRASPFVIVPTGTLSGDDPHRFVARLSLPSRLPYLAATAGTPVVIVGHPETAAAQFVVRHGLGVVVPYDRAQLVEAVEILCRLEAQARHRAAAAALAPVLSAEGMTDWLWRSLEVGSPVDRRYEPLERRE